MRGILFLKFRFQSDKLINSVHVDRYILTKRVPLQTNIKLYMYVERDIDMISFRQV